MRRLDDSLQSPTTTTTPRNLYPWENAILASAAAAVFALGIAVFIERPLRELWRWLLVGSLIPIFLFLVATIAPIVIWATENIARRDISGDGVVGKPHPVLVNPRQGQEIARRQTEAEYRAEVEAFIRGCSTDPASKLNSERSWAKRGVVGDDYEDYRNLLIGGSYAAWNGTDKRQGWHLLIEPEEIIREVWRA